MRQQLLKLQTGNSTKAERRIAELLKRNRIPFRSQVRIGRYCVDFLIGRVVLETDGAVHKERTSVRDSYLAERGYVPLHVIAKPDEWLEQNLISLILSNNGLLKPRGHELPYSGTR